MSKELALGIVIGSSVGGAINGIKSVIGGVDSVGKAVQKLNSRKLEILDSLDKEVKTKLEPLDKKLKDFYEKKRDLKVKVKVINKDIKNFDNELKKTQKQIDALNKRKLGLDKKFKDGTISAKQFNERVKRADERLSSLNAKKLNLNDKFDRAKTKAKRVNSALASIDRSVDKIRRNRLNLAEQLEKSKKEAIATNRELKYIESRVKSLDKYKIGMQNISSMKDRFRSKLIDTVAIGATVTVPLKVAIDYESAFADVRKVVNFNNKQEEKAFSKELVRLSTKIPLSATAIAAITASGGQLGIAKNKLLDFTKSVAKMKVAFDMNANEAGESIAKLMNIYSLNIKKVNNLGDAINYLSDNTAAKARDIVNVLARIGGTAKMFGLSAKQAASLSDAFLAMGKPPEVAATAINAMLNKLNTADKQGKKFQQGLDAIGFSAEGLKKAIDKDANGAIMVFLEQIKKFDKQKQMGILSDLFGMEYSDDIALLVSGLDNYKKALKLTADKQNYLNSMQKEFENRSSTTEAKLKLLKNSVSSIAISVGTMLLPVINTVADGFRWMANKIDMLSQKYPTLTTVVASAVIGLGAFAAITAIGGYAVSFLAGGALKAVSAFNGLKGLLLGGLRLKATATKSSVLGKSMCSTGACSIYAQKGLAGVAKTAIRSIGGILTLGSAFVYLNSAIAGAGKANIDSKRVMGKGVAELKKQEQYLKDRIKATKDGSLWESFAHGSNNNYKLKDLEKRLKHTQEQIKKLENRSNTPTVPSIDIPEINIPEIKVPNLTLPEIKIPKVKIPEVNIPGGGTKGADYKSILDLVKSGLKGVKDAGKGKKLKHTKAHTPHHAKAGGGSKSPSIQSSSRGTSSSRSSGNNYNINITLSGTNESLVSKLESLLPAIIKDIEADNIGRAMYDS